MILATQVPVDASKVTEINLQQIKVIDAIKKAADDDKTTVSIGSSYINQQYTGQPMPGSTFTAYASIPITLEMENFTDVVTKITDAGFSIESIYTNPVYPVEDSTSVTPEFQVNLNIAISSKPDTLQNVVKEYEEKYNELIALLGDLGISEEKIQPGNVSFNPTYYDGPGLATSYVAYTQFIVKTDTKNVNKVSDAAKTEGAYFENVFMSMSDAAIDNARIELNQLAFANAGEKANEMAKPLGLKVGNVKSIDISTSTLNPYGGIATYRGVSVASPYYYNTPGQEISISVTAEFELK